MLSVVLNALGVYKYLILAALAAAAYWFVWDTGRGFERARWEAVMAAEVSRQAEIIEAAAVASEVAAALLLSAEGRRLALVRRLQNEARNSTDADACGLGAAGVLRLNTLSGRSNAH